ncbi:hypothetical protein SLEP1_g58872 [Rubroshorea leprosula]|uniref:SWIM-type domain-containing protein n=1 Tax=Rubroshorea leprosula TaxID=152421 RepID=A0AAV5MTH4_9ROSI|nr:hypothetical protein SLEP1_g58872 [Rubroshorea leprosula]
MAQFQSSQPLESLSTTKPPFFDGTNYNYWKNRMKVFMLVNVPKAWIVTMKGPYVPMKVVGESEVPKEEVEWNNEDLVKIMINNKAINMLQWALNPTEFHRVSGCDTAKEMWDILEVTHEGTSQVKESKINRLIYMYELFKMKPEESIQDIEPAADFVEPALQARNSTAVLAHAKNGSRAGSNFAASCDGAFNAQRMRGNTRLNKYYGGVLVRSPVVDYVGGSLIKDDEVDPNFLCYKDIVDEINKVCSYGIESMFYSLPNQPSSNVLMPLNNDSDILKMAKLLIAHGTMNVFVVHCGNSKISNQCINEFSDDENDDLEFDNEEDVVLFDVGVINDNDDPEFLGAINNSQGNLSVSAQPISKSQIFVTVESDAPNVVNNPSVGKRGLGNRGKNRAKTKRKRLSQLNLPENLVENSVPYDPLVDSQTLTVGGGDSDYIDSDDPREYNSNNSEDEFSVEEYAVIRRTTCPIYVKGKITDIPMFEVGMKFTNYDEFKEAIRTYVVLKGYVLEWLKNDATSQRTHNCIKKQENPMANAVWLARYLKPKIDSNPMIKLRQLKDAGKEELNLVVQTTMMKRAKSIVLNELEGNYKEEYACLMGYKAALLLRKDLNLGLGEGLVVMSDQHKAIISSVHALLPEAKHKFCVRHLYTNWSKQHKGEEEKRMFWACAKSTYMEQFEKNFQKLAKKCPEGFNDISRLTGNFWVKAFFETDCKSDMVDNNLSEVFNAWILEVRDIAPRIRSILEENIEEGCTWKAQGNGTEKYEVSKGDFRFIVNMSRKECTCRGWNLTGIPCCHAICVMYSCNVNIEDGVAHWYRKYTYLQAYKFSVDCIEGLETWKLHKGLKLDPPPFKKDKGRPKVQRRKLAHETAKVTRGDEEKLSKKGVQMTCSWCGFQGHNKR